MRLFKGPAISFTRETRKSFEREHRLRTRAGLESTLPLDRTVVAYRFLDYLVETEGLLLHGSNSGDIERFEVRQPDERGPGFATQAGVFAASDGIWAMFFAIANRQIERPIGRSDAIMSNLCVKPWPSRRLTNRYFAFGLSDWWLGTGVSRDGWVYVLPREGFVKDSFSEQWVRSSPVKPLYKAPVTPEDFPALERVRGMSVEDLAQVVDSANACIALIPGAKKPVEIPGGHRLEFEASRDDVNRLANGVKRLIPDVGIKVRSMGAKIRVDLMHEGDTTELIEAMLAQLYQTMG